MVNRIQHRCRHLLFSQQAGQGFAGLHAAHADQHGTGCALHGHHLLRHGCPFFFGSDHQVCGQVDGQARAVGGYARHAHAVDAPQLVHRLPHRARTARQPLKAPKKGLKAHLAHRLIGVGDGQALLGLDGLVQTCGQGAPGCHAARELIEQHDLALVHQVLVPDPKETMHLQSLAQQFFAPGGGPPHGRQLGGQLVQGGNRTGAQLHAAGAGDALVILTRHQGGGQLRQQHHRLAQAPTGSARRQDEGCDRLVNQHAVGLVHDGRVQTTHQQGGLLGGG